MRIHHLNCGTLRPLGRRRINGTGAPFLPARLVCHCLLLETDRGLVLVDTGFGLDDIAERRRSLVRSLGAARVERRRHVFVRLGTRPRLDPAETAARQVEQRGFARTDVTDVVLTHLDSDHAGGLRDFPHARVHVTETELAAATSPASGLERFRYWQHQWGHGPHWVAYGPGGDDWLGFEGARELDGVPDVAFVPLAGHTRGHAGVALRQPGGGWLLHAGDAYFFHGQLDPAEPTVPPGIARFEARFEADREARLRNLERLRGVADEIELFCSHDPVELDRAVPA
ncbi:MAG TPA: MBL fold metallo-hydrolase [Solirubrobacteraceae bacterium]|nr:MBL fold metallo-hydrolase [Solirubrobacteraceae bacterium]